MARRRRRPLPQGVFETEIRDLTHEGRGVAELEGKTVFIDGALPGEQVRFEYTALHRTHDEGRVVDVLEAAAERVEPRCPHFGICGGCSLQHLAPDAQILWKQKAMLSALHQIGGVQPEEVAEPLTGPVWGYRHKARIGAKRVAKKGRVLVGFRERGGRFIADLSRCEVLVPQVGAHLVDMAETIDRLSIPDRVPQVEIATGDETTVLVFRHLEPLTEADQAELRALGERMGCAIALQPKGPDSIHPLWPETQSLWYGHPRFDTRVAFAPSDFIQVNPDINRAMVIQALEWLDVAPEHQVLDLFCGLGNFTLPLARKAHRGRVTGVEGDAGMVRRARMNAEANGIGNTEYAVANLMEPEADAPWLQRTYDRILLDPPRSGAREIIPLVAGQAPRIVYVSCHPGTLARDAGILVNEHGYRLQRAGVMDMFPHTAHVESMALFVKD